MIDRRLTQTRYKQTMGTFLKYWLPALVWLGVIFFGSTDLMSAEHTSRILVPFLVWLKPNITIETVMFIQFLVRKAAHLIEYAILAMVVWRALYYGTNLKVKTSLPFVSVWLAATLVAAADEYHQSFVPSRGAAWGDVLIDSGGAIFGLLISYSLARRGNRKSQI
jgi:VanZ family protein